MSKQSRGKTAKNERPIAREAVLAGIGAVSLIRRNASKTLADANAVAGRLPKAAGELLENAGQRTTATLKEIGARGNAFRWEFERLAKAFGQEAVAAGSNVIADVRSRIQPLLKKLDGTPLVFGITIAKPQPKRAAAKGRRKTAKKIAKRSARKTRKAA
jgi:hypothetical protein